MVVKGKPNRKNNVYHKILGSATDTKFAPHYANISMAGLEEEIYSNRVLTTVMATLFEWLFCLRADTIEKLEGFFEFPNSLYPSVKLTVDDSPYQVNYLDVLITKDESSKTLRASLYTEPADTNQYLHAQSCHVPYRKIQDPIAKLFESNKYALKRRICNMNWGFGILAS